MEKTIKKIAQGIMVVMLMANLPALAQTKDGSTKILFTSTRDGNAEIYVMDFDGSNQTRLTNNDAYDGDATWSPDGNQIAFSSDRDGNPEIYIMKADGSNVKRLTNDPGEDNSPTWSPDGSMIAFNTSRLEVGAVKY